MSPEPTAKGKENPGAALLPPASAQSTSTEPLLPSSGTSLGKVPEAGGGSGTFQVLLPKGRSAATAKEGQRNGPARGSYNQGGEIRDLSREQILRNSNPRLISGPALQLQASQTSPGSASAENLE